MVNGFQAFSDDPGADRSGVWLGAVFGIVGLVLVVGTTVHLARQPWDLDDTALETWGRAGERSPFTGDRYLIEVDGQTHECYRGRQKFTASEAPIRYDPADPSRCRAADVVGRVSEFERQNLVFGLGALLFGIAWLLAYLAEPREPWARQDPDGLLRPKLMWAARVALAAAALLVVVQSLFLWSATAANPPPRREAPSEPLDPDDARP